MAKISAEGAFGVFSAPSPAARYVALPRYNFLALAGHPVAVTIADASVVPEILTATGSKVRPWGGGGGGGQVLVCACARRAAHSPWRCAPHHADAQGGRGGGGAWRHA